MGKKKTAGFRRVGEVYDYFEGRPLYHYDCLDGPSPSGGCCHFGCRMAALRKAGLEAVAAKLEANNTAKDWLGNWGKMLYDPQEHGRDPKRRKAAAEMLREIRKRSLSFADACVTGTWAGALIGK